MNCKVIVIVFTMLCISSALAENISIQSGYIHGADLDTITPTSRWAGIFGSLSVTPLAMGSTPFQSFSVGAASVYQISDLPGQNLKDGYHYFGLLPISTSLNISSIQNVTSADLQEDGLFNQTNFPHFHPNYNAVRANPNYTFCCNQTEFAVDGINYTGYNITLAEDVSYGLLKYQYNSTTAYPLFLVELDDYVCVGSTSCNFEFLVPYDQTYYFYTLSKLPAYVITTYIDGVAGSAFSQPALPYNLTVRITKLYGGSPVENVTVGVAEYSGNNLFVPLRLSGITSFAAAAGKTDSNGYIQFVAVPTEYPMISSYYISTVILSDDLQGIYASQNLSIITRGTISGVKKPLSPSDLSNDGKVAINAINSLISNMYNWANTEEQTLNHDITVYNNGSISPLINNLGTGAPNVLRVRLRDSVSHNLLSGYVRLQETEGWLVMHPPTGSVSVIGDKTSFHREFYIPTGNYFLVAPTNNPPVSSTLNLIVYDTNYVSLANFSSPQVSATNSISDEGTGIRGGYQTLNENEFKTTINSMASIGSNLYYALN
ncbi:hypothetical protein K8R43_03310 [archaeon]|nr:hypothetical protein [archaeon]